MPSNVSSSEPAQEENLLIEAVSLLVQRQRETESWVAEQVLQAEERATATERHYTELETRLAGIEDQLGQLLREVGSGRSEVVDEGLARLREQVEDLKSAAADGRPARPATTSALPLVDETPTAIPDPDAPRPTRNAVAHDPEPPNSQHAPEPRYARPSVRTSRAVVAASPSSHQVSFLELLGSTREDRWGFALIVFGAIAVLYALLTLLPFR